MDAKMKKEAFKKWLDYRIFVAEANLKHQDFSVDGETEITDLANIVLDNAKEIHISPIEEACKILNIPYEITEHNDAQYPYEKYFMYNGYRIYGLAKEK